MASKKVIAVVGATGSQGGGVVDALLSTGTFAVRAITRKADSDKAQALSKRGAEVVEANLDDQASLEKAFAGAHGVFVVTNFWEHGSGPTETEQAKRAVDAAKAAKVDHVVWSTLPNVKVISGDKHQVPHFTSKAEADAVVAAAGFPHHTFVEAPFYLQNLTGMLAPQPGDDGVKAWNMPMDPTAKVIHAGDITELGRLVAVAFEEPERAGAGQHLSMAGSLLSWNEIVETLTSQGHKVKYSQVPGEMFDTFFPGAKEVREMFNYFTDHTYFGPDTEKKTALANELVGANGFTPFAAWAKVNMKV